MLLWAVVSEPLHSLVWLIAAPRLFYGMDMKKLAIAGALGFALFGGGTGLYYLNQQANDPFGGSN